MAKLPVEKSEKQKKSNMAPARMPFVRKEVGENFTPPEPAETFFAEMPPKRDGTSRVGWGARLYHFLPCGLYKNMICVPRNSSVFVFFIGGANF
jgi:hypothetical protein